MGVKGLFQFLKRFEKEINIPDYVKDKSVGIDIFYFIHKSHGDILALQNMLRPLIRNSQTVYCIFDGSPPSEKKEELFKRKEKRYEILETIERIEQWMKYPFNHLRGTDKNVIQRYITQLKQQAWSPSYEFIEKVKSWLMSQNCYVYKATCEADHYLAELYLRGIVQTIITGDSDLLVLGVSNVIRPYSSLKGGLFDREHICKELGFTAGQWNDFMYLSANMKETDILLAYSLISVYKDLDYALQKSYILYDTYLIKEVE